MQSKEFKSDYVWNTVDVVDPNNMRTCKGCARRDETTLCCDKLDTRRSDDDIACDEYQE